MEDDIVVRKCCEIDRMIREAPQLSIYHNMPEAQSSAQVQASGQIVEAAQQGGVHTSFPISRMEGQLVHATTSTKTIAPLEVQHPSSAYGRLESINENRRLQSSEQTHGFEFYTLGQLKEIYLRMDEERKNLRWLEWSSAQDIQEIKQSQGVQAQSWRLKKAEDDFEEAISESRAQFDNGWFELGWALGLNRSWQRPQFPLCLDNLVEMEKKPGSPFYDSKYHSTASFQQMRTDFCNAKRTEWEQLEKHYNVEEALIRKQHTGTPKLRPRLELLRMRYDRQVEEFEKKGNTEYGDNIALQLHAEGEGEQEQHLILGIRSPLETRPLSASYEVSKPYPDTPISKLERSHGIVTGHGLYTNFPKDSRSESTKAHHHDADVSSYQQAVRDERKGLLSEFKSIHSVNPLVIGTTEQSVPTNPSTPKTETGERGGPVAAELETQMVRTGDQSGDPLNLEKQTGASETHGSEGSNASSPIRSLFLESIKEVIGQRQRGE